jgi:ubiquinone/menaquinone biosynthesis C-methylase UbiE
MWLFLKNKTNFFTAKLKVLHIAPEQCFYSRFKRLKNLKYVTADMESPIANVHLDIQNMPFPDNEFDVVICNHVLEHVENDNKALKEIFRVIKPGGFAIMHVPMNLTMDKTYEDPLITDPKEREKHFRQKDHYRLYGRDFPERVKKTGFKITEGNYTDELSNKMIERHRLIKKELMYAYRK